MKDGQSGTALIVHPTLPRKNQKRIRSFEPSLEEQVEEAIGLAKAIWLDVLLVKTYNISRPTPGSLLGEGARQEIADLVQALKPSVVIVNHTLTPIQQRNLEKEFQAKVIDRTGLILEIFGARAQTKEGRIQVELAALEYQKSRLVRSWTHLERQRGGLGKTGGPGETQLELDRRQIVDQIVRHKKELEQVRRTRDLQRRSRERVPFPVVALVGYTNAGKSTLFNRMTGADVFAENLLFATLDPTMRKIALPNGQEIILSDTVGFISDLPTHLVASFRATLEQVQFADVILHVRDISNHATKSQREDVIEILRDLDIDYDHDQRIIEVYNKLDALPETEREDWQRQAKFEGRSVPVSALTGQGIDGLIDSIQSIVSAGRVPVALRLEAKDGEALAWLYRNSHIEDRIDHEDGSVTLKVMIEPADKGRFRERFGDHLFQTRPIKKQKKGQA